MSDSCQARTGQQNGDGRAKVSMEYTKKKKSCICSIDSSSCFCCCFCSLFSRWIYRSQTRYLNIDQTIGPTILEKLITTPVAAVAAVDVRLEMHKISGPRYFFSAIRDKFRGSNDAAETTAGINMTKHVKWSFFTRKHSIVRKRRDKKAASA